MMCEALFRTMQARVNRERRFSWMEFTIWMRLANALAFCIARGRMQGRRRPKTTDHVFDIRNFEKEIEAGNFRLELYFRINGAILRLPALRERKEDIPDLLECFLLRHANDLKKAVPEIKREARQLLFAYDWPGNIRELENVARKIVAVGDADLALADFRDSRMPNPAEGTRSIEPQESLASGVGSLKVAARAATRKTERELILKTLEQTHWNRKRAARDLQISYKSLLSKIKEIGTEGAVPAKDPAKS